MVNEILREVSVIVTPHGEEMHRCTTSSEVSAYLNSRDGLNEVVEQVIAELKLILHPGHILLELRNDDEGEYLAIRFRTDRPYFEALKMLIAWKAESRNRDLIGKLGSAQILLV